MDNNDKIINDVTSEQYKYGFVTDIDTEFIGKGINEDIVRKISMLKNEPEWLTEFRLKAYRKWITMKEPKWAHLNIPKIDFQDIIYYAAPKPAAQKKSLDEVDPQILDTFNRLGISLNEQKRLEYFVQSVQENLIFQEYLQRRI